MAICNVCGKNFKDKETRDNHIKKDHMKLTQEIVEFLVNEKGTPAENIARHFNTPERAVKNMTAQQKLEV